MEKSGDVFLEREKLTYADIALGTHNPVFAKLKAAILDAKSDEDMRLFRESKAKYRDGTTQKEWDESLDIIEGLIIKYNIPFPVSRSQVDVKPIDGIGALPIVAANMDMLNYGEMVRHAEAVAWSGGTGILDQYMPLETTLGHIQRFHSLDTRYQNPVIVSPDTSAQDVLSLLSHTEFKSAIIMEGSQYRGVVHAAELSASEADISSKIRKLDPLERDTSHGDALLYMHQNDLDFAVIQGEDGGYHCLSIKAAASRYLDENHPQPLKPHESRFGGLGVFAAVGINGRTLENVEALVRGNVDGIVMDTAHKDQRGPENWRLVREVRALLDKLESEIPLVVGNVVDQRAVERFFKSGATGIKVGIGPGSSCTTRTETGVGLPQASVVHDSVEVLETYRDALETSVPNRFIWADGGIRLRGDVAKALALGASQAMIGTRFAGTWESAVELHADEHGEFKYARGMASAGAAGDRKKEIDGSDPASIARAVLAPPVEGATDNRVNLVSGEESVLYWMLKVRQSLSSACTYQGAMNLREFRSYARVYRQTSSGYVEGLPKGF